MKILASALVAGMALTALAGCGVAETASVATTQAAAEAENAKQAQEAQAKIGRASCRERV